MKTSVAALLNFAGFQLGWFACVLGAAHGWSWAGPPLVALLCAAQLAWLIPPAMRAREFGFWASTLPLALVLDGTLQATGQVLYAGGNPRSIAPPPWIFALWPLFAATFSLSLRWLAGRYALAAAFGALGGPLSYLGGARLGALELRGEAALWLYAASWAAAMPCLTWMHRRWLGAT